MYETLAKQGTNVAHSGLAGIDSAKLKKLRNSQLKDCFSLIDEMRHKMEFVARIKGISFVDDAASRTTFSTWYALETIEGSVIWIANGVSDSNYVDSYRKLHLLVERKVKKIICVGDSSVCQSAFGDVVSDISSVNSIGEAVHKAFYSNIEDSKILFSPSVENGVSYEEQGDLFKHEVNEL